MNDTPRKHSRNLLGRILAAAFIFSMLMATGPGVLLVNRPDTIVGIPLVYAWGILWFFVIAALSVVTDRYIWRRQTSAEEENENANR